DSCDPASGCQHVDDCPAGQSCNRTSGACEQPQSSGCLSDAHCGGCQRCVNLACVPVVCGECEDCDNNHGCEPAENCCAEDTDCEACEACVEERCEPLECPEGTICDGAH